MSQDEFRRQEQESRRQAYIDACITKAQFEAECFADNHQSPPSAEGDPPSSPDVGPSSPDAAKLMTVKEVAAALNKSEGTIQAWDRSGKLKATKLNGRKMWRRKTVERAAREGF
ncbi:MAG: helix-turn-helix domain-containing protein [Planctomycetota bacterium]